MKKSLILLAALAFSVSVASAQTATSKPDRKARMEQAGKTPKTPEQRADHAAQRLTKQLGLSAAQTAQVRELHIVRYKEMEAKRTQLATTDKTQRHQEMKAGKERYETQLKQILSAEQYTKYAQLRAEKAEKHKGHRKAKG
ncbi:hypothetical protein KBK19_08230 [Microvirga sp. STR05]|uniref:DUF4890 domain-containing protein n=1 Tax=Hymenobacter duratus TaxID=2771356 RepID=A0ABR8JJN3_9BACT|nr:hypothetical protein [Hymenobacter duratus]MBD2715019.1 hypothetical protein [Hymenobacter duratus]MBR7949925.1 hypothetical protein [Microvirga sp. STR05]